MRTCRSDVKEEAQVEAPRGESTTKQSTGPDQLVVCAGQRVIQEVQSPSGARMRGAISESGGNASLAGKVGKYGEA